MHFEPLGPTKGIQIELDFLFRGFFWAKRDPFKKPRVRVGSKHKIVAIFLFQHGGFWLSGGVVENPPT